MRARVHDKRGCCAGCGYHVLRVHHSPGWMRGKRNRRFTDFTALGVVGYKPAWAARPNPVGSFSTHIALSRRFVILIQPCLAEKWGRLTLLLLGITPPPPPSAVYDYFWNHGRVPRSCSLANNTETWFWDEFVKKTWPIHSWLVAALFISKTWFLWLSSFDVNIFHKQFEQEFASRFGWKKKHASI